MKDSRRKVALVVTKCSVEQRQSDAEYWRAQSPQARLDALEEIREEYNAWLYGVPQPRLQKVYRIVKLK